MRLGLVCLVVAAVAHADVSASGEVPIATVRSELARLPLAERCALHRLLARSFIDVRDLLRLSPKPRDLTTINFVIILDDREALTHGLLLRDGEGCAALEPLNSWFSHQITVRFAGDAPPDADGGYEWLRLDGGDQRHFRFVRELNQFRMNGSGRGQVRAALPDLVIEVERSATGWVGTKVELKFATRSEAF